MLAFWGALGWFGCRLGAPWCFKVVFWCPSGVLWGALGVARGPLGAPRWFFGRLVGGCLAPLVPSSVFFGGPRGFSRILVAFPRETQQQKKEQSKRKRDTPTRTQHPLQNRASRSMTHRFQRGPWEPFGALFAHFWGAFGCSGGSRAGPLGSLGVLWVSFRCPLVPQGAP